MKKYLKLVIAISLIIGIHSISFAQPPPPNGGHGLANDQVPGGGAPVGEGMFLLIGLAGLYAGKKAINSKNTLHAE